MATQNEAIGKDALFVVWDILGEAGKQVIVVGVPQTYPVRPDPSARPFS